MNEQNFNRKLDSLVKTINIHPHREEILQLIQEQVSDDTYKVVDIG